MKFACCKKIKIFQSNTRKMTAYRFSGLMNRGASNIATDSMVAIKPCAFPYEIRNNETMK